MEWEMSEEHNESADNKRRISRPARQYSPIPEINKRRIFKKQPKLFIRRFNSGNTRTNSTLTSTYTTRENSYLDEEEEEEPFLGYEVISQKELRQQLENIKQEYFCLPDYPDLRVILENGHQDCSSNNLRESFLDEQEEIKLLGPSQITDLSERFGSTPHDPHSPTPTQSYSNAFSKADFAETMEVTNRPPISPTKPKLDRIPSRPKLKLKIKLPMKKPLNTTVQSMKRMRRPPQLSDEYVYTPLTKQRSLHKDALKIRSPKIHLQRKRKVTEEQSSIARMPEAHSDHLQFEKEISPVNSSAYESHEQISAIPSTSSSSHSVQSMKRMRRPPQLSHEYVFTSLKKQKSLHKDSFKIKSIKMHVQRKVVAEEPITPKAESNHIQLEKEITIDKLPPTPPPKIPEVPSVQMEFFERMLRRKQLNPFALGIHKSEQFLQDDYFYREILISEPIKIDNQMGDEDIEIDSIGDDTELYCTSNDELMTSNPADEFATAIQKRLSKDPIYHPMDFEQSDSDFDSILSERINSTEPYLKSFLDILLKFIIEQRHVDTVSKGLVGGASIFHSLTMKNANCLRESLKLYNKKSQRTILYAHAWILRNLPTYFIVSYLNLLRFLKSAGSNLSDHIVSHSEDEYIDEANQLIRDYIRQKIYEPPMNPNFKLIEGGPIPNVSLVLVYPQITTKTCKHIIRAHETLFRQLLPQVVCCVEKVELNFNVDKPLTVEECAWMCIRLIRKRVREIVKRRPNDHIFLAGWGTTCWINHKVIMHVSGVSGILNFAFPTESACGSRGSVDDEICLTYPSTLFVVGEDAGNVNLNSLTRMRKNMISDTGLIVVGSANHNLLVSQTRLSVERITQFAVQKTILEYALQFIKQVVADLGPSKECRENLKPLDLPNIYEVDIALIKPTAPPKPRKPPAEKKIAEDTSKSKQQPASSGQSVSTSTQHKISTHSRPTKMASHLPAHLQPVIPTSSTRVGTLLHSARTSFTNTLKSTITSDAGGIKIPSPETLNRQFQAATAAPSTATLQDTLREEEEAAAALSLLK